VLYFQQVLSFIAALSYNSFVSSYFLASFRMAPFIFNNILASIVVFLFLPIPRFPLASTHPLCLAPPRVSRRAPDNVSGKMTMIIGYHTSLRLSSGKCGES
jgi:hypothetical protein